jgi:Domain of unknown function (DUF4136)
MRVMPVSFILTFVLLGALEPAVAAGQQPTYAVKVPIAKAAELAAAKTYAWTPTQPAPDKTIDAQIMAAVDRQLSALGLMKMTTGKTDLLATYVSVRRTDVDLKSEGAATGRGREYAVGTLVVELRNATSKQPLFRVRIDTPIDAPRDQLEPVIDAAVTAMFKKYPSAGAKH